MSADPDRDSHARRHDPKAPGLPGELRDPSTAPTPAYERAFSVVAFTMNRYIVDHMLRSSRMFDGDIETMILFGVVSHLNVAHLMPPGTRPSEALDTTGLPHGEPQAMLRPVRLRDLVVVTGRPRESIRRRLERLRAAGRLLRIDDGWVLNIAAVDDALRDATFDGLKRFLATAGAIEAALGDATRALGGSPASPDTARPKTGPGS